MTIFKTKAKKTTAKKTTSKKSTAGAKAAPAKKETTKATSSTKKQPTAAKKSISMQSKVQQADELRKKTNKSITTMKKVVNDWGTQLKTAKSSAEKAAIDKKYQAKFDKADAEESQAYKKYYDFVHNNFSSEQVAKAFKPTGNFMNKSFITGLAKTVDSKTNPKQNSVKTAVSTKSTMQPVQATPKSGTKADYMAKNGIKIRPATAKDKEYAQTDYQKNANCIISIKGHQFFSKNGSLADCKSVVQLTQHQTGGKNGKK